MDLVAGRGWIEERRPIRHLDPVLLITAGGLALVGFLLVYSATKASLLQFNQDPGYYLKKQVAFAILGVVLLLLVATVDYRFFKVYAGFVYAASLLSLVLVRTPLGSSSAGAQRWFGFAGFQITPSEFTKVALVLMLAAVLSELRSALPSLTDVTRVVAIAFVLAMLALIAGLSSFLREIHVATRHYRADSQRVR